MAGMRLHHPFGEATATPDFHPRPRPKAQGPGGRDGAGTAVGDPGESKLQNSIYDNSRGGRHDAPEVLR